MEVAHLRVAGMLQPANQKPKGLRHHRRRRGASGAGPWRPKVSLSAMLALLLPPLASLLHLAGAIAPTIDYSHNMRILKLPKSVRAGELIYRLKGSDGDSNSRLHFGVSGIEGRALLDIVETPNSWNEADVYLRTAPMALLVGGGGVGGVGQQAGASSGPAASLAAGAFEQGQLPAFNLTIFVSDGNKSTQVESTLIVTNDDELDGLGEQAAGGGGGRGPNNEQTSAFSSTTSTTANAASFHERATLVTNVNITTNNAAAALPSGPPPTQPLRPTSALLSPFLRPRHVFTVPENTAPGESLGALSVRESELSDLPVRFELRGPGAEHFGIKYVFGPRGQSRGELLLAQPVDYERQNLFTLKVLALNAWTDTRYDTRNVATLDIVISVGDVQDSAPQWRELPHQLRVPNTARAGDQLAVVRAEDGDFGDQRPVQYALDASSPLVNYFAIEPKTGAIKLARPANELALFERAVAGGAGSAMLVVYASELPDTSSYEHLWPPMFARAELPLLMVDLANEPPRFLGGLQTQLVGPPVVPSQAAGAQLAQQLQAPTQTQVLHGFLRELPDWRRGQEGGGEPALGGEAPQEGQPQLGGLNLAGPSGQLVQWYLAPATSTSAQEAAGSEQAALAGLNKLRAGRPMVVDLNQGLNGTFELSLEGPDAQLFELEPDYPVSGQSLFNLAVARSANRSLFDADLPGSNNAPNERGLFQVDVVARDFGSPQRLAAKIRCLIELLDVNDNAPQFDTDLYTFQVYENAPIGHALGAIRARDPDSGAAAGGGGGAAPSSANRLQQAGVAQHRVRYSSLTGHDAHLFRLDPDSGLLTLAGQLDRERQPHYLLVAEAREASAGPANLAATNYTKIMVQVLDVNDNAPQFSQSHYDAVLLPDGSFHQPLVVSASDLDEPQSANSQVAYEIIAGNQNELFAIDALSGAIYPTALAAAGQPPLGSSQAASGGGGGGGGGRLPPTSIKLPPILSEPIVPHSRPDPLRSQPLDQHGRIRPLAPPTPAADHEVEETTVPAAARHRPRPSSAEPADKSRARLLTGAAGLPAESPMNLLEQLPAFDLLLSAAPEQEKQAGTSRHLTRSIESSPPAGSGRGQALEPGAQFDPLKVPPLTTLVVRAHDFGIPLRSATCKVNIYNQALLARTISVILNGTAEQLEQRRELIERAFGALTASKAQIESIDALSDSSSICVARLKLSIPAGHSLIDLTDLSALMQALDYRPASQLGDGASVNSNQQFRQPGTHYIATGDRLYPVQAGAGQQQPPLSNITGNGPTANYVPAFYTDINQLSIDSGLLERKLLFYIIIVGICILALLVMWMIYFCCRETEHERRSKSSSSGGDRPGRGRRQSSGETTSAGEPGERRAAAGERRRQLGRHKTTSKAQLIEEEDEAELEADDEPLGRAATQAKSVASGGTAIGNQLNKSRPNLADLGQQGARKDQLTVGQQASDHFSMYNGQVWFEQGGLRVAGKPGGQAGGPAQPPAGLGQRRASSAPSAGANSLDSSLRAALRGRAGAVRDGHSSAMLSPATSIMMQPMGSLDGRPLEATRGQFFPNTIGYMENLASIERGQQQQLQQSTTSLMGSGGDVGGGGGGGGTGSATWAKQPKSARRQLRGGKVVPVTLLNGTAAAQLGAHSNEAFENDLESGGGGGGAVAAAATGLVLVPASSLAVANELRRASQARTGHSGAGRPAKSRQAHGREANKTDGGSLSSGSASCSSGSAASNSGGARGLGANSRESVVLDSDQELLGFDSAGTPIIATHTRRAAPGAAPQQKADSAATTGDAGTRRDEAGARGETEPIKAAGLERGRATPNETQGEKEAAEGSPKTKAGEPKAEEVQSESGKPAGSGRLGAGLGGPPGGVANESQGQKSFDLMGELNERLASNQRQRALRRQSADEGGAAASQLGPSGEAGEPAPGKRRPSGDSLCRQSTISSLETTIAVTGAGDGQANLRDMKNSELLKKQSIFALTYNGLATEKLPT